MSSVKSAIDQTPGVVGVSAKHLESGKTIRHNADTLFFTASTFKVPLLVEFFRQVDAGKIDLRHRWEISDSDQSPGGGILKTLTMGLQPTIHDLAMLMIIISDNTATDIIYNLVGRDSLNQTMQNIGLSKTKIPMNCKELLFDAVGLDVTDPRHTSELVNKRLSAKKVAQNADSFSEDSSDVSSPDEMCLLLEMLYRGELMSAASTESAIDILKSQQLNNIIPLLLPQGIECGHKTGTYQGVRCDVGLVFTPDGTYTVSIMAKQLPPDAERTCLSIDLKLAAISKAIYDAMIE